MNPAAGETIEPTTLAEKRSQAEKETQIVLGIVREYAPKLATLNEELLFLLTYYPPDLSDKSAWLLDQSEILRQPLLAILSRGSGLREIAPLEPITKDELSLRMFEIEIHLHHMIRHTNKLHELLASRKLTEQVAKLRMAAGLPGGQNGARVGA